MTYAISLTNKRYFLEPSSLRQVTIKWKFGCQVALYTLLWGGINAGFGLAALWGLFYSLLLDIKIDIYKDTISEGFVSFFCIAIMGSVCVDYLLSHLKWAKLLQFFIYTTPLIACGYAVPIYVKMHSVAAKPDDLVLLKSVQTRILILAIIYCLLIKSFLFINDLNRKTKKKRS